MDKEEDKLIEKLILEGGLEVAGIDSEDGSLLYAFTPKIREMYRPYIRNSRIIYENTKDNTLYNLNRFFRNIIG